MRTLTIANIKDLINRGALDDLTLNDLRQDERKGVKRLIASYDKQIEHNKKLEREFHQMMSFERAHYQKGLNHIAGVDEAGRGPLAGPVVAAAVILPRDFKLLGLTDSKALNEQKRQTFYEAIVEEAISYDIAVIDNDKIDELNILQATKLAMNTAINNLDTKPDHVLIDAVELNNPLFSTEAIIKGDAKSISIAAASILAKVTRDRLMGDIHQQYPIYQFNNHKGYGTAQHLEALREAGPCPYHRTSFAPVKNLL